METIIGLLVVLIPVIFNIIGKRLEKSGMTAKAEKVREIAKTFAADGDDDDTFSKWLNRTEDSYPAVSEVREEVVEAKPVMSRTILVKAEPVPDDKRPDESQEKIDPRKLVIYSEIMKPKFIE